MALAKILSEILSLKVEKRHLYVIKRVILKQTPLILNTLPAETAKTEINIYK